MNKKILLSIFAIILCATAIGLAKAQINVTLNLTDKNSNALGITVPAGTTAYIHASYQDVGGNTQASAVLEMDYNGTTPVTKTILYSGNINSGQTITETAILTKPGSYQFKWTCTQETTPVSSITPQCIVKVGFVTATVSIPLPEPGTLAGLTMALGAFGLLALKKAKR